MARNLDSKCKKCRRAGEKLFLKGDRCFTPKCAVTRRNYAPGQHGQNSYRRLSEFGKQLREKQKVRQNYDILEKPFREYFKKAVKQKGVTGENLLSLMERRLDNVIFRMQLAKSRRTARQLIRHGHIDVNGAANNLPSYQVKMGDKITVREKSVKMSYFENQKKSMQSKLVPGWLDLDAKQLSAEVVALPSSADIDQEINIRQIVEFYSR